MLVHYVNDQPQTWTEAFRTRNFAVQFIVTSIALLIIVSMLPYYFHSVIGPKSGLIINDVLLNAFTPRDNSWIIFGLIYLSLVITLQGLYRKPDMVLLGLKCYLTLTLLRMVTMYVFTLEAPEGMIPLHDPLMDKIAYGGNVFNKDLFFSGHVATLTLFVFLENRAPLKRLLIINTIMVAIFILLQRVHYTLDVIAAPVIIFIIVKINQRRAF